MTRLNDLLDTFVQVIVKYHSEKMNPSVEHQSQLMLELKTLPREELNTKLVELIQVATNLDGSKARLSLMMYLVHNIDALKSCIDYQGVMPESSFNTIKTQWIQLILDLQTLLMTSQYTDVPINYNEKEENIPGLIRGVLKGYSFCTAGTLIQDVLLNLIGGAKNVPKEKVTHTINDYFNDHELEISKQALKDEQKKVQLLTVEVDRLKQTIPLPTPIEPPKVVAASPQKPIHPIGYALLYPCINDQPRQSERIRPRPPTPAHLITPINLPRTSSSHNIFNTLFWTNLTERPTPKATEQVDDIDDCYAPT